MSEDLKRTIIPSSSRSDRKFGRRRNAGPFEQVRIVDQICASTDLVIVAISSHGRNDSHAQDRCAHSVRIQQSRETTWKGSASASTTIMSWQPALQQFVNAEILDMAAVGEKNVAALLVDLIEHFAQQIDLPNNHTPTRCRSCARAASRSGEVQAGYSSQ